MKLATCPAQYKAAPATDGGLDAGTATFEAIVSVFGNADWMGDVVMPGAFKDNLAEWKASGDPIPVYWSHRMDDPMYNIGAVLEADELEPGDKRIPEWADQHVKDHGGLWVKAVIDTGDDASPIAVQARKLLLARRVKKFSFAYDVLDEGTATVDGEKRNELRRLKIHEVSPTPIGANDLTELLTAKAAQLKAGRVLSKKNENAIRDAIDLLSGVVASLDDDGDTADAEPAKAEEPHGVKAEEPARLSPESVRLLDRTALAARINELTPEEAAA